MITFITNLFWGLLGYDENSGDANRRRFCWQCNTKIKATYCARCGRRVRWDGP